MVAVPGDSPYESVSDLPSGVRVSTEYPELTRRFLEKQGIAADIRLSYGATEGFKGTVGEGVEVTVSVAVAEGRPRRA